jgi:hypothetical protein
LRAALGATVATGARFLINALIEPGLVLAATRGEMASR